MTIDFSGVNIAIGQITAKGDPADLRDIFPRRRQCRHTDIDNRSTGNEKAQLVDGGRAGGQAAASGDIANLKFIGRAGNCRIGENHRSMGACAVDGHLVPVEIGRTLVIGCAGHIAVIVPYQSLPFVDRPLGIDGHRPGGLLSAHQGCRLDVINKKQVARLDDNIVSVSEITNLTHIEIITGIDLYLAIFSNNRVDDKAGSLVDGDIPGNRRVDADALDKGVELNTVGGQHVEILGNKNRGPVGRNGSCGDLQMTCRSISCYDATLHSQSA